MEFLNVKSNGDDWLNLNDIIRFEINLSRIIKIRKIILFNEIIDPIDEIEAIAIHFFLFFFPFFFALATKRARLTRIKVFASSIN